MNAEVLFQAVQAAAVVVGVGFAVYETRRCRRERNREAAMELLQALQTPEFAKAPLLRCRPTSSIGIGGRAEIRPRSDGAPTPLRRPSVRGAGSGA